MGRQDNIDLSVIENAANNLKGQIERTPMRYSRTLSDMTGAQIWLKFENLQYTASFKERGALIKLRTLGDETGRHGVIAMSAGNHAQGVAYHAKRMGFPVTIVMPQGTPFVKIDNTERLGAKVVLFGESVDDAAEHAHVMAEREGFTFIHPFDDPSIIAGQGTIALEMLADAPDLDTMIIPIGGGGLISGMSVAAKAINPAIEILGVESALYPSAMQTLSGQKVVAGGRTLADGIAVKRPGKMTLEIIRDLVSKILLVDEPALERAVLAFLEIEKTVVEGAGAAGLAAALTHAELLKGRKVGLVLCGGNIDSRLLSDVIVRGLVNSNKLVRFAVALPDSPGALAGLSEKLAASGANIVDVIHRRAFSGRSVREAVVDLTLETRHEQHARLVEETLNQAGFRTAEEKNP